MTLLVGRTLENLWGPKELVCSPWLACLCHTAGHHCLCCCCRRCLPPRPPLPACVRSSLTTAPESVGAGLLLAVLDVLAAAWSSVCIGAAVCVWLCVCARARACVCVCVCASVFVCLAGWLAVTLSRSLQLRFVLVVDAAMGAATFLTMVVLYASSVRSFPLPARRRERGRDQPDTACRATLAPPAEQR